MEEKINALVESFNMVSNTKNSTLKLKCGETFSGKQSKKIVISINDPLVDITEFKIKIETIKIINQIAERLNLRIKWNSTHTMGQVIEK